MFYDATRGDFSPGKSKKEQKSFNFKLVFDLIWSVAPPPPPWLLLLHLAPPSASSVLAPRHPVSTSPTPLLCKFPSPPPPPPPPPLPPPAPYTHRLPVSLLLFIFNRPDRKLSIDSREKEAIRSLALMNPFGSHLPR